MKRAYDFCTLASAICGLPIFLLNDHLDGKPLLCALLFLPSLLLSGAAAILNHRLPPAQQEKLEVDWRLRPSHPYWWFFLSVTIELLFLLSGLVPQSILNHLIIPFLLIYLTVFVSILIVTRLRKRSQKVGKRHNK